MSNWLDKIKNAVFGPSIFDRIGSAFARTAQRHKTRQKLGVAEDSPNFYHGYSSMDEKAKERYRTKNPLDDEKFRTKYPDATPEELDEIWDNQIMHQQLKNSKHPEVQKLYHEYYNEHDKLTDFGKAHWDELGNRMANLAMTNDIDGLSDEKE